MDFVARQTGRWHNAPAISGWTTILIVHIYHFLSPWNRMFLCWELCLLLWWLLWATFYERLYRMFFASSVFSLLSVSVIVWFLLAMKFCTIEWLGHKQTRRKTSAHIDFNNYKPFSIGVYQTFQKKKTCVAKTLIKTTMKHTHAERNMNFRSVTFIGDYFSLCLCHYVSTNLFLTHSIQS